MASTEDNFLTDEVLSRRESNLLWSTFDKRDIFTNAQARRHLTEGFDRRHYMLQLSRLFLCQNYSQSRKPPLSSSEATHCAIHLNAYYLNLRGTLDNLAWVLQYEWQLFPGVSEEDRGHERQACDLFHRRFLAVLQSQHSKLASILVQHRNWADELAELRNPAAHRVPIYIAPSLITTQEQVDEFRRIEAQADRPPSERSERPISDIYREAQAVADFAPVMVLSSPQGLKMRWIDAQIRYDHDKYLTIASAVVDAL